MKILVLAGGSGTRLWPFSRALRPKQVQPFLDRRTLLQHTWARLRSRFPARDIFVSTTAAQAAEVRRQLPALLSNHLILEPVARNTAAAIGLAALVLQQLYPGEVVAVVSSDHHVTHTPRYFRLLSAGERAVRAHPTHLLLVGLKPTYPETGYGYIKLGRRLSGYRGSPLWRVAAFSEKPSLPVAKRYVSSGRYLWNTGLFMFYPAALLALYQAHAPTLARGLKRLPLRRTRRGAWTAGKQAFQALPAQSIDYAVVEKCRNLVVLTGRFGWADVGHWRTIYDILAPSRGANVVRGRYVGLASAGNLVYSQSSTLVATVGVNDMVIVATPDALLICPRAQAQEVKLLVTKLKRLKLSQYL